VTELALALSIFAVAMAFTAVARSGGGRSRADALNEVRLGRVERRLQELASFVGVAAEAVPPPSGPGSSASSASPSPSTVGHPSQEVLDLVAAGQKIQAIKLYRTETGVGLKEAKDAVEAAEGGFTGNG
jgi:ribosomal protein L7/L12